MKLQNAKAHIPTDDFFIANAIINHASDYFHLERGEMKSDSRQLEIVKARHIAMYACWKTIGMSCANIGSFFCRDHATVLHAITSVKNQVELNSIYRRQVSEIMEGVKNLIPESAIEEYEEVFQENDFYTN